MRPSASAPNKRSRILNFFIDDLNFNGFMMCLQSKPFCGEVMLPCRCDEDTSFAMLRMRTAMDTDACSVRNVFLQRKRTFELRRTVDHNRISAFRNEIFCILQGVAQGEEVDVATFIIENMRNLQKVIIQDPNPDAIKERISTMTNSIYMVEYVPKQWKQFYISQRF